MSTAKGQSHQGQKTTFFGPFGGLRADYVRQNIFSFWFLFCSAFGSVR